jgi:endonuclease-3 related protein
MFTRPTVELRQELLELNGVGPETADSILLYGGNHPVFVVDAYTRRILDRHRIFPLDAPYDDIRRLFESALGTPGFVGECESELHVATSQEPRRTPKGTSHSPSKVSSASRTATAQVFNEMHGLIVGVGKNYCLKSSPLCENCPLEPLLPRSGPRRQPARRKRW